MKKVIRNTLFSARRMRACGATLILACFTLVAAAPLSVRADDLDEAVGDAFARGVARGIVRNVTRGIVKDLTHAVSRSSSLFGGSRRGGPTPQARGIHASLAGVKSIAVIRPFEPRNYEVAYLQDNGGDVTGFTYLHGAGDQGAGSPLQTRFTASVKHHQVAPISTELASGIASRLKRAGFATRIVNGPWEITDDYETIDFDKLKSKADAVMVIKPTLVGFFASNEHHPFRPVVTAIITVLNSRSGKILYRGFVASGWNPGSAGWRYAATNWKFYGYEDIASQPEKAAAALDRTVAKVAATVTGALKK